ncbi:hypothetical protein [Agrobacterium pusense]|uniref:hypothetical protein n=1 Tax=Agrobacterium pusense TaxID=648995 RepID=UPI0028ACB17B|nr:hypothetical protein [Agrobacterium pusense]
MTFDTCQFIENSLFGWWVGSIPAVVIAPIAFILLIALHYATSKLKEKPMEKTTIVDSLKQNLTALATGIVETTWAVGASLAAAWCTAPTAQRGAPETLSASFFMPILSFFANWKPVPLPIAALVHQDFPTPFT